MKATPKANPTAIGEQRTTPTSLEEARAVLAQQARTIDRLNFLVEASQVLNSTLDLGELLGIILKMATDNTGADRGSLFLVDHQKQEIWSLVAQGLEQKEIRLPAGRGIAGWVAESGEVVNLADAYEDPRFDRDFDQRFGYRTRSLLCLPIRDRMQKVVGVLQLLNKRDGLFGSEDVDFLQALSVPAAIALENARLHREALEKQKLEREMALARGIQQSLLPTSPPSLEGFEIAVRYQSALEVGGDYYDFIPLDENTWLVVVADVQGKGVSSALIMSNLQATLQALVPHLHSLEGILFTLNQAITSRSTVFLTLFVGLLDLSRRGLHYINAGHPPPVILRAQGERVFLQEGGLGVGLFPEVRYDRGSIELEPGDLLLAWTDGITEATDREDQQYEIGRLTKVAERVRSRSADEIVDTILADVTAFSAGSSFDDDKVILAIKVR